MISITFTDLVLDHWQDAISSMSKQNVLLTGHRLTIGDVVVVARQPYVCKVGLATEAVEAIAKCSNVIEEKLAQGEVIYGVNTGFGGSADTRTKASDSGLLQQSLLNHLMCGVLAGVGKQPHEFGTSDLNLQNGNGVSRDAAFTLPLNDPLCSTCMPESWARAAMLVRSNSLAGGASGIRVCIAESLVDLLTKDVVPLIPIRGTISASGDLCALSYVGALLQGRPSGMAFVGPHHTDLATDRRRVVRSDRALHEAGITPINFRAKEGLAIVNGTAVSAGIAALAVHECINLAALSQVLTAMSVEALCGTKESFEPFIAQVRPHPGQVDSARNIFSFLADSKLVVSDQIGSHELRQDRYSIRTASQWIGPVLEDFMLAYRQIAIELNSVTDNPLIKVSDDKSTVFHGGNFQARVLTSAVEKLRQGLQTIGRMLFSQCTELMNPATNRGLQPNLASDEPSESYLFKGIDVMTAALTSELGFLANPVGSHVQTAEMGNQALNSLALISARYTLEAVDIVSQLSATHIMSLCQALDLRALMIEFHDSLKSVFCHLFATICRIPLHRQEFYWNSFVQNCEKHCNLDSPERFRTAIGHLVPLIARDHAVSADEINQLIDRGTEAAIAEYQTTRIRYKKNPGLGASPYLGKAAKRIYQFVREDLRVPFLGESDLEGALRGPDEVSPSVGTYQTVVYEAIRSGRLYSAVLQLFDEVGKNVGDNNVGKNDVKDSIVGDSNVEDHNVENNNVKDIIVGNNDVEDNNVKDDIVVNNNGDDNNGLI